MTMTTIRIEHYLNDEDADDLTASGAAYAERLARRKKIDDTVAVKTVVPDDSEGDDDAEA